MFRGLINDAKSAVGSVLAKYAVRASVAVPFVVALGFATAAATLMLVERFGAIAAYWLVAGAFAAVGLIAAVVVTAREEEHEFTEAEAERADTSTVANDAAAQAAMQMPLALLGALFTTPAGPTSTIALARVLGRNLPLVLLLALIAMLFWPSKPTESTDSEEETTPTRPNGVHPFSDPELEREAA